MPLVSLPVSRRVAHCLLVIAGVVVIGGVTGGCGWMAPRIVPSLFDSPQGLQQELQQASDARIADAVTALDGQGKEGDRRAADAAINDAVRLLGGGADAYAQVGHELIDRGHPAEAAHLLDEAAQNKDNAQNPNLWATLALAYDKAGDTTGESRANQQADQIAQTIMASVGKTPVSQTPNAAAIETISNFLEVGQYYLESAKNTSRALAAFREAYRLLPDSPLVQNALGYTLADKGTTHDDFKEALRLTRAAVETAPNEPVILDSYGWALFKTGDLAGARRVLRKAADSEARPEYRYHLGVVYGQMGLIDDARREFDRALALRKNYEDAETAKKQLQQPPGKGVTEGA